MRIAFAVTFLLAVTAGAEQVERYSGWNGNDWRYPQKCAVEIHRNEVGGIVRIDVESDYAKFWEWNPTNCKGNDVVAGYCRSFSSVNATWEVSDQFEDRRYLGPNEEVWNDFSRGYRLSSSEVPANGKVSVFEKTAGKAQFLNYFKGKPLADAFQRDEAFTFSMDKGSFHFRMESGYNAPGLDSVFVPYGHMGLEVNCNNLN